MNAPSITTCPACGSTQLGEPVPCKDHFVTQEVFHLRECQDCGFKFTSDAPDAEHIGRYYKSDAYISHSDTKKGLINQVYHWVRSFMLGSKRRLIAGHTKGLDLLDIGCGTGYFLHHMTQHGYRVAGIEVDADARAYAAAQFGLKVDGTDVVYQENRTNTYDVITLWHVLEHLYDAPAYLKWINQALKPDGVLVIAIPNHSSLDASVYGSDWAAYDPPRHLWHFKPGVLDAFIKPYGFKVVQYKGMPFDAWYNSLMSAKYTAERYPLLNGFLTGLRSNLNSLGFPERSSSVIYIIRKIG